MSIFDKDLKVGDIITAYHKGYHKVVQVERRFVSKEDRLCGETLPTGSEYTSLIHYQQYAKENGEVIKPTKTIKSCDSAYCRLASDSLSDIKKTIQNLTQLVKILES